MKSRKLTCITAVTLLAALAVPVRLAAQELTASTGTTNFIPIWTNSTTLGNSTIFETGGKVGVGNTSPAATLDVKGSDGSSGANAPTAFKVRGGIGGTAVVTTQAGGIGGPIQLTAGPGGRGNIGNPPGGSGGGVGING